MCWLRYSWRTHPTIWHSTVPVFWVFSVITLQAQITPLQQVGPGFSRCCNEGYICPCFSLFHSCLFLQPEHISVSFFPAIITLAFSTSKMPEVSSIAANQMLFTHTSLEHEFIDSCLPTPCSPHHSLPQEVARHRPAPYISKSVGMLGCSTLGSLLPFQILPIRKSSISNSFSGYLRPGHQTYQLLFLLLFQVSSGNCITLLCLLNSLWFGLLHQQRNQITENPVRINLVPNPR